jgi:hypothetical protein
MEQDINEDLEVFLTPGLTATQMNPSWANSWAYSAVNMFNAVFEIL